MARPAVRARVAGRAVHPLNRYDLEERNPVADYCTWQHVAKHLGIGGTDAEEVLTRNVATAMGVVHQHCGWRFDTTTATYVYPATDPYVLDLGDLPLAAAPTSIAVDADDDGVYETTVSAGAYVLRPSNGQIDGQPWPYTEIVRTSGVWPCSTTGRPTVQIVGSFGWPSVPAPVVDATVQLAAWVYTNKAAPNSLDVVAPADQRPPVQLLGPYRRPGRILAVGMPR